LLFYEKGVNKIHQVLPGGKKIEVCKRHQTIEVSG